MAPRDKGLYTISFNLFSWTAKSTASSKVANPSKPAAGGGPARFGGGAQRGGAQGMGRSAPQAARPTGGAGGASAALVQKDAQIQELNNEVC